VPPLESVFQQVAAILVIAAVVGTLARLLRQPLIIGFIAVGILVGPLGLGIVEGAQEIELLATLGISLLLFIVGLKLDLRLIRTLGPVALATGLGQVTFTSAIGFVLALGLGFAPVDSLYIAVALTFSSTIIIVKLLTDKGETEQLHGRIAIGFLIVQDIVVVIVMILLSAFGRADAGVDLPTELALVAVRGVLFVGGIALVSRYVLPHLLRRLVGTPELFVLFAVTWAVTIAATGDLLGFSEEVGAFLAGVSLASTPYREALAARLGSLRDFLLLFFFVDLGAYMDFGTAGEQVVPAIVLSLFVLIGNPLIVMVIMGAMRYRKRVGFLAGLTVAQISEFSLIFAALGVSLGHITGATLGMITTVGVITIGLSTYLILNSQQLYARLEPWLRIFERAAPRDPALDTLAEEPEVIVVGLGRYGGRMAQSLAASGIRVLGVDVDPDALDRARAVGLSVAYGDIDDPDLPGVLPLGRTAWVVSSVRSADINVALIQALRAHGYGGRIAVAVERDDDDTRLRGAGADLVLLPLRDAADTAIEALGLSRAETG
jgi:Kef-type K+ transport system membrane component KefB/voltage-gated potassium channel Kch